MTLVQPTPSVLHIQTETVKQHLSIAPSAEQNQLDGVSGHGLICLGIPQNHIPVIGQRDGQDDRDGLGALSLLSEHMHLPVCLDLADGCVHGGGAEVGNAAE